MTAPLNATEQKDTSATHTLSVRPYTPPIDEESQGQLA